MAVYSDHKGDKSLHPQFIHYSFFLWKYEEPVNGRLLCHRYDFMIIFAEPLIYSNAYFILISFCFRQNAQCLSVFKLQTIVFLDSIFISEKNIGILCAQLPKAKFSMINNFKIDLQEESHKLTFD